MAIMSRSDVERLTRRGVFHARSGKLRTLLSALETHRRRRETLTLITLRQQIQAWVGSSPKEYAKRHGDSFFYRLQEQLDWEERFLRQVQQAKLLAQQLLQQRGPHIVNDADTTPANKPALKESLRDQLKMAFERTNTPGDLNLAPSLSGSSRTTNYWQILAEQVHGKPTLAIRCGECAALVVRALRNAPLIQLPIAVIEQGTGAINGHFWVVVGYITNESPKLRVEDFGFDTFAIDLWGKSTFDVRLVNGPPATIPMSMGSEKANKIKILARWPATGTAGPPPT